MNEAIEQFFAALPARAPEVLRTPANGVFRIDLDSGSTTEHWTVTIRRGSAVVGRGYVEADTVWRSSEELFGQLVTGRSQSVAALLRNDATLTGNAPLFLAFHRFFPSAPGATDPRVAPPSEPRESP